MTITNSKISQKKDNDLYQILKSNESPGLVLFSSGSEGESKPQFMTLQKF